MSSLSVHRDRLVIVDKSRNALAGKLAKATDIAATVRHMADTPYYIRPMYMVAVSKFGVGMNAPALS